MTLQQIIERLEEVEQMWSFDSGSRKKAAIERLRLDVEIAERKQKESRP